MPCCSGVMTPNRVFCLNNESILMNNNTKSNSLPLFVFCHVQLLLVYSLLTLVQGSLELAGFCCSIGGHCRYCSAMVSRCRDCEYISFTCFTSSPFSKFPTCGKIALFIIFREHCYLRNPSNVHWILCLSIWQFRVSVTLIIFTMCVCEFSVFVDLRDIPPCVN